MLSFNNKIVLTSLIAGLAPLIGCQPDGAVTQTNSAESAAALPDFAGSGSEPFWNMKWQEQELTVRIMPDDREINPTGLTVETTSEGWRLTGPDDLTVSVKKTGCLDMAEARHDYEIDAMVQGRRLVGCANPL